MTFKKKKMKKEFKSLAEFYPYYLLEHQDKTSRTLHFIGTALFISIVTFALFSRWYSILIIAPICAYGFAWVGHFFFEKNKPATFNYPGWSLVADFKMFWDILTFQLQQKMTQAMKTTLTKNANDRVVESPQRTN